MKRESPVEAVLRTISVEAVLPRIEHQVEAQARVLPVVPRPADLMSCYLVSLPVRAVAGVLGVPGEDLDRVHAWSLLPPGPDRAPLVGYLDELVARRRNEPADDLLGLVTGSGLTAAETVDFATAVLVRGWQPITHALCRAALTLLRHPERIAALRADAELPEVSIWRPPLSRLCTQIALRALVRAVPGMRLAVPEEWLTWRRGPAWRLPATLPVTW